MLLAALMMVSALPVYAAGEPLSPSPELLFLDNGVFWGKTEGDTVYAIIAHYDQSLMCSIAHSDSDVVFELQLKKVPLLDHPNYDSNEFWENLLNYCKEESNSSELRAVVLSSSEVVPYNAKDDLRQAMIHVYGQPGTKILKTDSTSYPVSIHVRETSDLSISKNGMWKYSKGLALTTFVSFCISHVPALKNHPKAKIALWVCNAVGHVFEYFDKDGAIEFYDCSFIRHRYTNINGNGPYSEAVRADYLIGVNDAEAYSTAYLSEILDIVYTPNQSYYQDSSYSGLIRDGYWSYTH